jgi:ectoine hydroxylase-related dioxygenase (phytanoyl-CoA dioxygenase family)
MVSGVPGDLEVSSVSILHSEEEKTGSRDELPIWKYNRTDEFFEKGVLGPFRSPTLSAKTLNDAFDAMSQHRKRIRMRRTQELRNLHGDKYELQNYYDKYGETDYRIERCYMFDDRCRRLAEDPGIIEIVRKTMNSDDIIVWSMSDISKANSTIQPWHTDIEPYDRCYNSNVQIWLAVDGVSSKSTLQVMTHSHRFPSATWLFPDHVIHTNKIYQKEAFEKETLLTCAKSLHPGAAITSPVVKNMDFMVLHSNVWHAASDLLHTGQERRKAIRITFAHPKCQIGAVYKYERPDLPPLNPIAMLPPVLLVSGQDHSSFHQKDNLQITNSFLHFTSSSHRTWSQQDLDRRTSRLSSQSPLSEVVVWKTKDKLLPLWMNHKKRISKVLLYAGNTKGLFKTLEIAMIRLSPNIANHDAESHLEPSINVIVEGQMAVYTHIEEVAHNGTALAIPSTLMLPKGSVSFVDSNIIHCDISGPQGTWIFNIKYEPHDFLKEKPTKMSLQSFGTPPDDSNFFNIDNSMLLKRVFAKTCRCIHDTHADDDHETVMFIESVPDGVTLYLLPDRTPLEEKAVMYYPLYSSHGIEARNDTTNEVIPYRKRGAIFDLIPRCLVIEFWTPKPKANFNQ